MNYYGIKTQRGNPALVAHGGTVDELIELLGFSPPWMNLPKEAIMFAAFRAKSSFLSDRKASSFEAEDVYSDPHCKLFVQVSD